MATENNSIRITQERGVRFPDTVWVNGVLTSPAPTLGGDK